MKKSQFPEDDMKYKITFDRGMELIDILRCLMKMNAFWGHGDQMVLGRTWEFGSCFAAIFEDGTVNENNFDIFPENPEQKTPFRVSGERLVERSALMDEPEETIVYRVSLEDDSKFDLAILDDHRVIVWTDNEAVYQFLSEKFKIRSDIRANIDIPFSPDTVRNRTLEAAKIIGFTILASIIFGWAHDLVTAHVYPPYFLPPNHMIIMETESPLLLALIWGVVATWLMGAFFGILLALTAQLGSEPLPFSQVKKPITFGLVAVLILAYLVLASGFINQPPTEETKFDAVLRTHNFSYAASAIFAFTLMFWMIAKRIKYRRLQNL